MPLTRQAPAEIEPMPESMRSTPSVHRPAALPRRRPTAAVLMACVCLLMWAVRPAEAQVDRSRRAVGLPDFQRECELLIDSANLRGGTVAVSVIDADTGEAFVRIDEETPMTPASTMKLLTTGAALHVLGSDFRFRTRLLWDEGRMVVVGDGDPGFGDPILLADTPITTMAPGQEVMLDNRSGRGEIDVDELLDLWVRSVVKAGITEIEELVIDDRIFDRKFVHANWPRNQLSRHYCAGVAGINFHANILSFHPFPTSRGGVDPGPSIPRTGFIRIENSATADPNRPGTASVERHIDSDQLILMGNVRIAYEFPLRVTVNNPPEFFARLLAERLERAGVHVRTWSLAEPQSPPGRGRLVAPEVVTPLQRVLERANADSHNLSAEALFKRIAAHSGQMSATYDGAAAFVRDAIRQRLQDERLDSRLRISDGSGLSRDNQVPAALLTKWLRSFHQDQDLAPLFRASLAVMGRTGTLRNRLTDPPPPPGEVAAATSRHVAGGVVVRGKSGTIDGVSGLAGYVIGPDRTLCFCILVNDYTGPSGPARELQDRIVMRLAEGVAASP